MSNDPQTAKHQRAAIVPLLSVRKGASAIEFYKRAFGADELFRIEDDKGDVVARLSVDGAEFWLADESPKHLNFSPESLGGGTVRIVLTVEDPDAVFEKAVAAGATVVSPICNQYRWRLGRIVDPFGAPLGNWQAFVRKPVNVDAKTGVTLNVEIHNQ